MRRLQPALLVALQEARRDGRAFSITSYHLKESDPLSAILDEMENCDTGFQSEGKGSTAKTEEDDLLKSADLSPPPAADARVRLEEAKRRRLQSQLKDVSEELSALLNERSRAAAQEANKMYVPARAAKTFLSSAELVQEKSPQEFIPDEKSVDAVAKLPSLQHSGCAAVVTLVGVVTEAPREVKAIFPGGTVENKCTEFSVSYEIPFVRANASMRVAVRAVGATLSTFALECVGVGDVVHVLGHLAPEAAPGKESQSCVLYVLPAGGNISVVLSKASG